MSKPIIQVEGIGKSYKISHELRASMGNVSIRDGINNIVRKPIELITGHRMRQEKFWALKDINFEVEQGEVLGIIGKNGSGKSTLLKILSRITEPTTGEIRMHGRVASLLEVGTGFHPELTGRENIYFNGSILGMRKKEIESKFDEIVAFSEVEKFLDTPVKFYSSGMYVRLAFAVAAHLEPDILIVDEVLAVGDAAFQKKCLGKMRDVAGKGRTVLFVSHSMPTVQALCAKTILLENGEITKIGDTDSSIRSYLGKKDHGKTSFNSFQQSSEGKYSVHLVKVSLNDANNKPKSSFKYTEEILVKLDLSMNNKTIDGLRVDLNIYNEEGTRIACFTSKELVNLKKPSLELRIRNPLLSEGTYTANISILSSGSDLETFASDAFYFEVAGSSELISGASNIIYQTIEVE